MCNEFLLRGSRKNQDFKRMSGTLTFQLCSSDSLLPAQLSKAYIAKQKAKRPKRSSASFYTVLFNQNFSPTHIYSLLFSFLPVHKIHIFLFTLQRKEQRTFFSFTLVSALISSSGIYVSLNFDISVISW